MAGKTVAVPVVIRKVVWAMVVIGLLYAACIFVIPLDEYRFFGNFFEVLAALTCMACSLYAYRHLSPHVIHLLAAFAFGEYALLTIFWYSYTYLLNRTVVFTSVSELGFFGFLLFFIALFRIGFPETPCPKYYSAAIILLFLIIPTAVILGTGISLPAVLLLLRFLVIGILIDTALTHRIFDNLLLGAGISLWCIADLLYGFRETLFISSPMMFPLPAATRQLSVHDFLSIVGPMFIISFAIIQLGLFSSAENKSMTRQ